MTLSRMVPRAALGILFLGGVFTLAAPLLPLDGTAQAGEEKKDETTITIATSKDKEATVLKLDPMKPGETKTVTSESGKPVVVTRTDDGYTIKTGEREIKVKTSLGDDGPDVLLPGGQEVRMLEGHGCDDADILVTGDGAKKVVVRKNAFAYHFGDEGEKATAGDVLKKAAPKSLEALDRKTRDAVEQVLQEMLDKGALLAPGALPLVLHEKHLTEPGDGEKVKVMVIREKTEDGAKK